MNGVIVGGEWGSDYENVLVAVQDVLKQTGNLPGQVITIGFSNQRETTANKPPLPQAGMGALGGGIFR